MQRERSELWRLSLSGPEHAETGSSIPGLKVETWATQSCEGLSRGGPPAKITKAARLQLLEGKSMDETIATAEELRKWIFIGAAFGLPVLVLVAYLLDLGSGFAAGVAVYMIVLNAGVFWRSRQHAWFWSTIIAMVTLHSLLVVAIPWPKTKLPGRALLPFGLLDFFLIFGSMKLARLLCSNRSQSK